MNQRSTSAETTAHRLTLGRFELDLLNGELLAPGGELAGLRKQALEVLLVLGRRTGQVVGKDELMRAVWPRVVVSEGSLTQAVSEIRKLLGDSEHRLVRNVARRGYMLVPAAAAPSQAAPPADEAAPSPPLPVPGAATPGGRPWTPGRRVAYGALAAVALTALAIGAWLGLREPAPAWQTPALVARAPLPEQVPALSIAVLPLTVEGDAGDSGWLADALHGDLITQLTRAPDSIVIARDTMTSYAGKAVDPRQVARELGVRHVVRGSLRREGETIRLNFALVDGGSGVQRWADSFVTRHATLAQTLGDFATQLERALQMQMVLAGAARPPTLSPEQIGADELAMRGFAVWYRGFNRDNLLAAREMLERAVQRDADVARAWHGIAVLTLHGFLNGWGPDRDGALRRIEEAGAQLERIDREGNWTYTAKTMPLYLKGESAAMLTHTRAWTEQHGNATAFGAHGMALLINGRFDDAARAEERALRLSPLDPIRAEWQYRLAMAHFAAGRYELAREWSQTAVTSNPALRWPPIHAAALWRLGQPDAAREAVKAHLARHAAVTAAQLSSRLPGREPAIVEARERLLQTLRQAGMP